MDIVKQLDGERIAKDLAARSQAFEVLNRRPGLFNQWHYWLLLVLGSVVGGALTYSGGSRAQLVLAPVAAIALFLGGATFQECLRLRRRLDAAIVLLRINER